MLSLDFPLQSALSWARSLESFFSNLTCIRGIMQQLCLQGKKCCIWNGEKLLRQKKKIGEKVQNQWKQNYVVCAFVINIPSEGCDACPHSKSSLTLFDLGW